MGFPVAQKRATQTGKDRSLYISILNTDFSISVWNRNISVLIQLSVSLNRDICISNGDISIVYWNTNIFI